MKKAMERWKSELKKVDVHIDTDDERLQVQIKLIGLTALDLRILKWAQPGMKVCFGQIMDDFMRMIEAFPELKSREEPGASKILKQLFYDQLIFVFSGQIDRSVVQICRRKASILFAHKMTPSYYLACLSHLRHLTAEAAFRKWKTVFQLTQILTSMDKMMSFEQQLVIEAYQACVREAENQKEKAMRYKAYHDTLTGLPNRRSADEAIRMTLDSARRNSRTCALFTINIDRFKMVNEVYGRHCGDLFLQTAARRLQQAIKSYDTKLFRINSDEFCVLLRDDLSRETLAALASRMVAISGQAYMIKGRKIFATVSVGIACYPRDGENDLHLRTSAEAALREAKQGKTGFFFYNNELHNRQLQKVGIENDLHSALHKNQFLLYYQPQIRSGDRKVIGTEALIRWSHPQCGLVSPNGFIPVAEETGQIREIGNWVIQEACRQMKAWQDAGSCKIPVSVNLSFSQFHDDQLPEYIRHVLQANGLDPQYLILEITESMMAEDFRHSARMLREIKDMGIKVSVDDFGTGYSSLSYLKHLPVDRIKIDRSFVTDIAQNKRDKAIVAAIVDLAEHLLIEVIAEGIENEEQLHAVEQCRCRAIQGFYYSRPLSCGDFQRYMMTGGGEIS